MNTPFTDDNLCYGKYVTKKNPVVMANKVRELERDYQDQLTRCRQAENEIDYAHRQLDLMGVARLQPSGFPFSLKGRLTTIKMIEVKA